MMLRLRINHRSQMSLHAIGVQASRKLFLSSRMIIANSLHITANSLPRGTLRRPIVVERLPCLRATWIDTKVHSQVTSTAIFFTSTAVIRFLVTRLTAAWLLSAFSAP